ncbi:asparagine synthase (glutamine-hydrolyzing) [Rhizobium sp. ARZ01]|uniref:asparagine synthase (glutamine-hydrolyzing) n=1 Tax=Rhizobium sp. ARZ01 TaxID=2769313 RepID=UPI00177C90F8|nr:asparagine synthase (glutamine-hydrolyzing) [Rhizobium sp. ARZ01]MBD9374396.1 asparagine synthase (glutamine-hydrolyzing) [Rhizobium sp. ARZ01]
MCGIAGWIGPAASDATLRAMTDIIHHRGPDGDGHAMLRLGDGTTAALGHRRLAIIDLTTGDQPMKSHDGRFTVVYNGEIYNYLELRSELKAKGAVLRTHSDTEVILEAWRAWGKDSLVKLRGMFAFALHDNGDNSVVLARDPFGKKPLFYATTPLPNGQGLVFGSEVTALLEHPAINAELDVDSLHDFLCWRYVPGPNTFFRGIRKLAPGGLITWKAGQWREERYWVAPEAQGGGRLPVPSDPIAGFLEVFDEAVRLRLRADVPLGAFLSSGLDSSSIVATLKHLGAPEIRTFSVGFRGDMDAELPAAADTARLLGTIHTPIELETDDMADLLPMLSRHRGAPMSEVADLPIYMMSVEAARHVKVVLSGEGSDELFAGYPKHLAEAHLGRLAPSGIMSLLGRGILAATAIAPKSDRRLNIAGRALRERRFEDRMVRWFGAITPAERAQIWTGPPATRQPGQAPFQSANGASPLRQVLHFDQTSWLPDNLLERMDAMTMAASIEGRAPFMDIRLAEYASSLPEEWRIKGRTTKRIVREALAPRLPEAVLRRPKNGFRMPVSAWFRGQLREPFNEIVLGSGAITRDYLDPDAIRRLMSDHSSGRRDHAKTLWALFALETFLCEFF